MDSASSPQSSVVSHHATAVSDGPVASHQGASFDEIYEAEFSFVCKVLRRLGATLHEVPDLAQEVFLVVHRRLSDFDRSRPLRPWLFGIAYRILWDDRRLARRKREVLGFVPDWSDRVPGADRVEEVEARGLVLRALDSIDSELRAVIVMHDIEEFTMPEIAAALSIPLNTGYSRLRLARERFGRAVRRLRALPGEVTR